MFFFSVPAGAGWQEARLQQLHSWPCQDSLPLWGIYRSPTDLCRITTVCKSLLLEKHTEKYLLNTVIFNRFYICVQHLVHYVVLKHWLDIKEV